MDLHEVNTYGSDASAAATPAGMRNPLHCIVPPHMLKNMYSNGTAAQKRIALGSIAASARLRGLRHAAVMGVAMRPVVAAGGKRRRVFTAENGSSLPGRLLLEEGAPPVDDAAANEAYDGSGATYDLFWEAYKRDSLDGRGLTLDSTVHYRRDYDNAFWDGGQMVYGDGDGQLFKRFTLAIDVIGHELTHGLTQYTCDLMYSNEPGALNESLSDIFGSLVKQRRRRQTASEADWLLGEGLFTANVKGVALRSLKEPGTAYNDPVLGRDPQPAHMRDFVHTADDDGGIHINSGIPNHAFFLAAAAIGGFAWEQAGLIWYTAARDKYTVNTDFAAAAAYTFQTAAELYGKDSPAQHAVQYGWEGVGIPVGATPPAPQPKPSGCSAAAPNFIRSLVRR